MKTTHLIKALIFSVLIFFQITVLFAQEKDTSYVHIKIVKDGETNIDTLFFINKDMTDEDVQKIIAKIKGEKIFFDHDFDLKFDGFKIDENDSIYHFDFDFDDFDIDFDFDFDFEDLDIDFDSLIHGKAFKFIYPKGGKSGLYFKFDTCNIEKFKDHFLMIHPYSFFKLKNKGGHVIIIDELKSDSLDIDKIKKGFKVKCLKGKSGFEFFDEDGNIVIKKISKDSVIKIKGGPEKGIFILKIDDDHYKKVITLINEEKIDSIAKEKIIKIEKDIKVISKDGKKVKIYISESSDDKIIKKIMYKIKITDINEKEKKEFNKSFDLKPDNLKVYNLKYYSNPNNGKFTLDFDLNSNESIEIQIFNMSGEKIYDELMENFTGEYHGEIDLSDKGVYILKIIQGGKMQSKKIIVE